MDYLEQSPTEHDGTCDAVIPAPEEPWRSLVEKLQQQDPEAMAELYGLICKFSKYRYVRILGVNRFEDTVHDVFVRVINQIRKGNLREPDRLMGFIRTVARRAAIQGIRCEIDAREKAAASGAEYTIVDKDASADGNYIRQQRLSIAQDCLGCLSPRNRELLERFYLREESAEQIQKEMGLTDTQFRLFKSRAKRKLSEIRRKRYGNSEAPLRSSSFLKRADAA